MLFDEPTRGIDIAAKRTVYRVLAQWAARGKALVVVSSELRELMTVCDRIAVLSAGRLVADVRARRVERDGHHERCDQRVPR